MLSSVFTTSFWGSQASINPIAHLLVQLFTHASTSKLVLSYILFIVYKYRRSVYGVRPRNELKGPRGLPLLGNFWGAATLKRNTVLQRMTKNHALYGKVYTEAIPRVGRVINIMDPEKLDHILRVNFWAYEKGAKRKKAFEPLVGSGKEEWVEQKNALNYFNDRQTLSMCGNPSPPTKKK